MSLPPLLQPELPFHANRSDFIRIWNRERGKRRFHRIGERIWSSMIVPLLMGLLAFMEAMKVLRIIPAPVWTIASMLISIAVYSSRMGWALAWGFIILLLIHECGHLLAARWYGARISVPIFIPYIGAIIDMKQPMRNAWEEAVFGISGPVLGSLGAFACLGIHQLTGSFYFAELALFGFFLNLFNLIPLGFLDGGHVAVALSRWLWVPGYLMMAAFAWFIHSPAAILVLVVMLPMVHSLFRRKSPKHLEKQQSYDRVSLQKRLTMGVLYVGLVAILFASMCWVWCKDIYPALKEGKSSSPLALSVNAKK
jgi:membrane-associated protease RseP (regulator of RpoE activity)